MNVQKVFVSLEVNVQPQSYENFKPRVALEAVPDEGEDAEDVVAALQETVRVSIVAELLPIAERDLRDMNLARYNQDRRLDYAQNSPAFRWVRMLDPEAADILIADVVGEQAGWVGENHDDGEGDNADLPPDELRDTPL